MFKFPVCKIYLGTWAHRARKTCGHVGHAIQQTLKRLSFEKVYLGSMMKFFNKKVNLKQLIILVKGSIIAVCQTPQYSSVLTEKICSFSKYDQVSPVQQILSHKSNFRMPALQICIVITRYLESNFMVWDVGMVVKTIQKRNLLSMVMQITASQRQWVQSGQIMFMYPAKIMQLVRVS